MIKEIVKKITVILFDWYRLSIVDVIPRESGVRC